MIAEIGCPEDRISIWGRCYPEIIDIKRVRKFRKVRIYKVTGNKARVIIIKLIFSDETKR